MRLLVDAQLPPAFAHWLGEHGLAVTPVQSCLAGLAASGEEAGAFLGGLDALRDSARLVGAPLAHAHAGDC